MNYLVEDFVLSEDNQLLFTSDLHFFHKKIIDFTGRPTSLEYLSSWIISQCNSKVDSTKQTTTIHLGDMFFSCTNEQAVEVLKHLKGDWWFILGNHDNPAKLETVINTVNKEMGCNHRVLGWYHRLQIKIPPVEKNVKTYKKLLVLCHFPIEDWDGMRYNSWMVHGHLHGSTSNHGVEDGVRSLPNRFDVGIDNSHTYTPFTFKELREIMAKTVDRVSNGSEYKSSS